MDEMIFQSAVLTFVDIDDIERESGGGRNIGNEKYRLILLTVGCIVIDVFDQNNDIDREIILIVSDQSKKIDVLFFSIEFPQRFQDEIVLIETE